MEDVQLGYVPMVLQSLLILGKVCLSIVQGHKTNHIRHQRYVLVVIEKLSYGP